ncbi:MAG: 1-acyl-sn-glycerol-3-phosphate acyltransferase [Anaerolineae bacterium]|jgi:1-acyl-sn-glycerol-3-phosphate acyltransferase|nr:1-acyl-sn-glycerol-3-phosphate acyltransferase [Anaerolineae bacterium]
MSTSSVSSLSHVHDVVYHQERYTLRRRFIRGFLLRQIGFHLLVKADVHGLEHIPAAGPTLLVMNHIAAIDPFVVVGVVRPRFVVPMSKIENYRHPVTGLMARSWGAYPVRRGEVDRQALGSTVALLDQGYPVLIAPEGTRQIALAEAKDGMTYVAIKAGAVIVPIGLEGTDQFPRSLKRLRRAHVTVRIGRAFRFRTGEQKRIPRDELRHMTREAMCQLAALLPEYRRGAYSDLDRQTTDYLEFVDE